MKQPVHQTLERILSAKREEVESVKKTQPRALLEDRAAAAEPPRTFREALLRAGPVALIAELKKASPSAGVLREDFPVEWLARRYHAAGAAAVSVLTERAFFLGDPAFIELAKSACPLPTLRKDFIFDEYQVVESRAIGADAILLIATILEREQIECFTNTAHSLGMQTLLEIHSPEELERVSGIPCDIIGVNNRNLATMEVDIGNSIRLAPSLKDAECRISESGISSRADVEALAEAGYDGILVGASLVTAPDPAGRIRELMQPRDQTC